LRQHWLADLPNALGHWFAIDTMPLPVKHPSRVRGVDLWIGPDELHAGFGRCAAKATWFDGFRLALCGPLIDSVPWVWALVPAAGNRAMPPKRCWCEPTTGTCSPIRASVGAPSRRA
jgi:hypothetical protein